jgi:pyridoxamine 5'-phosphate oxidase
MDPGLPGPDPALAGMRQEYMAEGLDVADLDPDPLVAFATWLREVAAAGLAEPNAMVVSTVGADGVPTSRMALLKSLDARGFVFFTNYSSRKAVELAGNPRVCLLFPWHALRRQVIVSGIVARVSPEESAAYFRTRPRASQLGAWTSRQSQVLASRAELDERYEDLAERWPADVEVPAPDFWGGYLVEVESIEFWQGRASRLHDRLCFTRQGDDWTVARLAP